MLAALVLVSVTDKGAEGKPIFAEGNVSEDGDTDRLNTGDKLSVKLDGVSVG
jgi:hypothetical protein